ncbi:hypothetical protein Ddc_22854 [Ditylenchus destructor]|nr:hypothetical protein Ddc_22854 [Ditylenchus destructor]
MDSAPQVGSKEDLTSAADSYSCCAGPCLVRHIENSDRSLSSFGLRHSIPRLRSGVSISDSFIFKTQTKQKAKMQFKLTLKLYSQTAAFVSRPFILGDIDA